MNMSTGVHIDADQIFRKKNVNPTQEGARVCPNCGAPILSEVCQYCGTYVGQVSTAELTPEYELIHCKQAALDMWKFLFPLFMGVPFFGAGITIVVALASGDIAGLSGLPFALIGTGFLVYWIINVKRYLATRFRGVDREGVVYGYMDDVVAYNGRNGQQIKILLDTSEGKKFIILPLQTTVKPYEINSPIRVRLYKKSALILTNKSDQVKW